MEKYKIIKLENNKYDYLVIATAYENPLDYMDEIINEINQDKVKIIFDFTLINGLHNNRYIEFDNDQGKSYFDSFRIVKEVSEDISNASRDFFCENDKMVQDSIIPRALKYLIKTKLV